MYSHKQNGRVSAGRQSKDVLRRALIERDPVLERHGADVAEAVARRLRLPESQVDSIRLAAELCNVGTVAIPDARRSSAPSRSCAVARAANSIGRSWKRSAT